MNFNFKLSKWRGGLCHHSHIDKKHQKIIQILAGPVLPAICAYIFFELATSYYGDYTVAAAIFFLIFTTASLIYNLIPKNKPIKLEDGTFTYNDGYLLLQLYKHREYYNDYNKAINLYLQKEYKDAAIIFINLIEKGMQSQKIYQLAISSSIISKKTNLDPLIDKFLENFIPTHNDLINIGYYYTQKEDHNKALEYYQKSLAIEESWNALNNIGYSYIVAERYYEALEYLDKAIAVDNMQAYSLNNRGLAKIKLNLKNEGLKDLETGYKIDPNNSYYYKTWVFIISI